MSTHLSYLRRSDEGGHVSVSRWITQHVTLGTDFDEILWISYWELSRKEALTFCRRCDCVCGLRLTFWQRLKTRLFRPHLASD